MPDVFIPMDTSTLYHRQIVNRGVLTRFSIKYVQENRSLLKSKYATFKKFNDKFEISDEILNDLVAAATEAKIEYNEEQFTTAKPLIKTQLKAAMARDFFEDNEYYQVHNEINESYKEALRIISDDALYNKIITK